MKNWVSQLSYKFTNRKGITTHFLHNIQYS